MSIQLIIGVVVGSLVGYGVYFFVGCSAGACPITASPWLSTLLGTVFGGLLANSV